LPEKQEKKQSDQQGHQQQTYGNGSSLAPTLQLKLPRNGISDDGREQAEEKRNKERFPEIEKNSGKYQKLQVLKKAVGKRLEISHRQYGKDRIKRMNRNAQRQKKK
jgi:hypothetical protein